MDLTMNYYFAPMEGITGYVFRNTFQEYFGGIHTWFSPFLSPKHDGGLRSGEIRDILPENNSNVRLVPQILTNDAAAFRLTAERLKEYGYSEVNLNLGCPSGTVVAKKRVQVFWQKQRCWSVFWMIFFPNAPSGSPSKQESERKHRRNFRRCWSCSISIRFLN